ncbi:cytochrome c-type biogenesis protein CcmH [Aquabacterium soli]|uniref:Cytochrome c-type biogenesis protein n=2 Tax=Aquabacterium soli TaxID=2493092 RepID=A0A3R8TFF2_9BURK|nr:cytochrome c-type biogenesis protein CcmH [Aquabacterium soli]
MTTALTPAVASPSTDAQLDERVNRLAGELRCLVCQNQTIAESSVPLARQLKAEVRTQLAGGASEQQVRDFMARRYGDFILYRPPVTQLTWLLWGGPLLLLLLGGLLLSQQRARARTDTKDDAEALDDDTW